VLPPVEHAKNAHGISQPSLLSCFTQNYLVAMATSLAKSKNKVQIPHLHPKCSHMVKRLQNSVQYIQRYLTKYAEPQCEHATQFPSVSQFSAKTTGPIFTKLLHDIVALVALLNHAYTRLYPIPFLNARVTKVRSLPFFSQNWLPWQHPWDIGKKGPDCSSAPKMLSFSEKFAKIGPANPEITVLQEII